jgi:hypothetical protein
MVTEREVSASARRGGSRNARHCAYKSSNDTLVTTIFPPVAKSERIG